jgi:hypothetical protein
MIAKNIGNKIPKLLQIMPATAIFLPSWLYCFISFNPIMPSIKPIAPRIIPSPKNKMLKIDIIPSINAAIALHYLRFYVLNY